MKPNRIAAAAMFLLLTQTFGCGDGGGNNTTILSSSNSGSMKGIWTGTQNTVATSAIVLADGDSWMVFNESGVPTRLAHIKMTPNGNSFGGSGKLYPLTGGSSVPISAGGAFSEKKSLSATISPISSDDISPIDDTKFELAYDSKYETTVNLNAFTGSWTGTSDGGTISRTMNIAANGNVTETTGASTTGCTYAGTVTALANEKAVFELALTETCVDNTTNNFKGIATLNAAKTNISFAATTTNETKGIIFMGAKQ